MQWILGKDKFSAFDEFTVQEGQKRCVDEACPGHTARRRGQAQSQVLSSQRPLDANHSI